MNALKNICLIIVGAVIGAGVLYIAGDKELISKIGQGEEQENVDTVTVVSNDVEDTVSTNDSHEVVAPKEKDNTVISEIEVPTADWFKDPMCRIIFFATLEGLYNDGVPTEVVNSIIGKNSSLENKVKHNFVFRCDLCHAVYEAFVLYQRRQTFYGSDQDTFGNKQIDERTVSDLEQDAASTRVFAMGRLVQPWIKNKLYSMNLGEEEKQEVMNKFIELAKEGANLTLDHRREDPDYYDWSFYGTCQACEAIKTVSEEMGGQH